MARDTERPRGGLTHADRAYLRGEKEYNTPQQEANRRRAIRKRIANSLLDFNDIKQLLREKDRKIIFSEFSTAVKSESGPAIPLPETLQSMIYWIYLGAKEQGYDFEQIIDRPIRRAEADFSRKYHGEVVDAEIHFNISRRGVYDIEQLISDLENGNPVHASTVYELAKLPDGVPIDTDKIDIVRVITASANWTGELAVIESLFSEYLGVDVDVESAISHADVRRKDDTVSQASAVVEKNQERPSPRDIPYRSQPTRSLDSDTIEEIREQEEEASRDSSSDGPSSESDIIGNVVDEMMEGHSDTTISLIELHNQRATLDFPTDSIGSEEVHQLLRRISEDVVTEFDVAAALDCPRDAVDSAMQELVEEGKVTGRTGLDSKGDKVSLWWLRE